MPDGEDGRRPDLEVVRVEYEGIDFSVAEVAARNAMTVQQLYEARKRGGWKLRRRASEAVDRSDLIARMFRLLERQTIRMEENVMTPEGEKEVALLGAAARTLEKLIEIDAAQAGRKPDKKQSRDVENLREKLLQRIEQLKRS